MSLSMRNGAICALFEVAKMAENHRPGPFAKSLSRTIYVGKAKMERLTIRKHEPEDIKLKNDEDEGSGDS